MLIPLFAALLPVCSIALAEDAAPGRLPASRPVLSLPTRPPVTLKFLAKLPAGPGTEISGIVRSRTHDDCFWTLNDSGNEPRIYAIRRNGTARHAASGGDGVLLAGARNVDWEDIAADADGRLIVADVGNNSNNRQDLTLYVVGEPAPGDRQAAVARKWLVRYPDQSEFPAPRSNFNFDCEAIFTVGNVVHLLSKNRSDRCTTLYRLDDPQPDRINVLTKVDTFDVGGMVTAADASPDGKRLVVATYQHLWLFERSDASQNFFEARISWTPIAAIQVESVCFADEQTLLLADELLGTLYELPVSALTVVHQPPAGR